MKRVVIVGGGYAGTMVARALDGIAEVRLIEPRDHFVHNVAAIRALVDPSLLNRLIIPYDRLLRHGSVIRTTATAIAEGRVTLADGSMVEGDIIVAATGSSYALPFKPQSATGESFANASRAVHDSLRAAGKIAIVGGGAVGIELAGEISTAYPSKKVTLLASSPGLLPGYAPRLSASLASQLSAQGVNLRLGARVEGLATTAKPFSGTLTAAGETIAADLIIPAIGARPQPPPLAGASLDAAGRMAVDAWLRPAGLRRVFALGDAAATGDLMTIVAITRQAPWLIKTLKSVLAGRDASTLAPYRPWTVPVILVPLGPSSGASVLPITRTGLTVGRHLTAAIKGRHLFIPRYRKEFGYANAPNSASAAS